MVVDKILWDLINLPTIFCDSVFNFFMRSKLNTISQGPSMIFTMNLFFHFTYLLTWDAALFFVWQNGLKVIRMCGMNYFVNNFYLPVHLSIKIRVYNKFLNSMSVLRWSIVTYWINCFSERVVNSIPLTNGDWV